VVLTTHHHLAPGLRMSGATAVLPLHAVMSWVGITLLSFYLFMVKLMQRGC